MDSPDVTRADDLKVDVKNLYREEMFTDLKFATIRRLTPVLPDGQPDDRRKVIFVGQTQMMTPAGSLPIQFEIDARNLKQAMDSFPEHLQQAVSELVENAKEAQRQEESRIITPGTPPNNKLFMP